RQRADPRPDRLRVHAVPAPQADRVHVARRRLDTRGRGQQLRPHPRPAPPDRRHGDADGHGSSVVVAIATMRFPLGVASVTFPDDSIERRAERARELGFEFIDVPDDADTESLAVPVACTVAIPPRPGWCWSPALPEGPG